MTVIKLVNHPSTENDSFETCNLYTCILAADRYVFSRFVSFNPRWALRTGLGKIFETGQLDLSPKKVQEKFVRRCAGKGRIRAVPVSRGFSEDCVR